MFDNESLCYFVYIHSLDNMCSVEQLVKVSFRVGFNKEKNVSNFTSDQKKNRPTEQSCRLHAERESCKGGHALIWPAFSTVGLGCTDQVNRLWRCGAQTRLPSEALALAKQRTQCILGHDKLKPVAALMVLASINLTLFTKSSLFEVGFILQNVIFF